MKAIREQSASPQARIRHAIVGALVFALAFAALTCFATAQQAQADEDGGQGSITFTDCKAPGQIFRLFGGFCGRDSGIGPAQRAKTTIWN